MLMRPDDMWDPNTWVLDDHEHRIYATDDLEVYAIVDAIDYPYLSQFKWSVHDRKKKKHPYLHRKTHELIAPEGPAYVSEFTGRLVRNRHRIQRTVFLHTEIMLRKGEPKPTPKHKEPDHLDRNVLNCRRANLKWATRSDQVKNSESKNNVPRKPRSNV
jgi:hypothetical protein